MDKPGVKRFTPYIAVALIFVVLLCVRVFAMTSRHELHSDETFSVMLAQCNPAYFTPLPTDTTLTGAQIKQMLVADHSFGEDIAKLYVNNADIPHASLYYMALRVALTGFDSFDPADVALRGGILNLLFFAIAFYALWRTCRLLFGRLDNGAFATAAVLVVAFANGMSVNNTLLVREYQMAEMFICLSVWASAAICSRILNGSALNIKLWTAYSLAIAGAISTGYLNSIFIALLSLSLFVVSLLCHRRDALWGIFGAPLAAILLAWLLYVGYFNFILYPTVHTNRAFSGFGGILSLVFVNALTAHGLTLFGLFFLGGILILALLSPSRREMVAAQHQWWLPIIAITTMIVVEYASLLHAERYIYPFVSTAGLLPGIILCGLNPARRAEGSVFVAVYMLFICITTPHVPAYGWANMSKELSRGAVLYRLNANELPQIAPTLNDTAHYHLITDAKTLSRLYPPTAKDTTARLPLVSRVTPPIPITAQTPRLTGPLKKFTPQADSLPHPDEIAKAQR